LAPGIAVGGQDSAAQAGRGGRTDKMWRAPNGARLRFAYLERDADADLPVSAPASSIRSAPSYWSVPLPCGKACASCALSYHAFSPRPAMPCRHACCASSRIWQRTGRRLDERIGSLSSEIEVLARRDVGCERLMSVRAIGPTISSAMVAAIGSGDELAPFWNVNHGSTAGLNVPVAWAIWSLPAESGLAKSVLTQIRRHLTGEIVEISLATHGWTLARRASICRAHSTNVFLHHA
jgi:hypothetical protein